MACLCPSLTRCWMHGCAAYEPPVGTALALYTTLARQRVRGRCAACAARASARRAGQLFASFSAAQWLAPYGRTGPQYFYADEEGSNVARRVLKLSPVSKGENVVVTVLKDRGCSATRWSRRLAPSVTSPVQTYLDLAVAGERGREAADHLRQRKADMAKMTPGEPQSAADYDDRTTAAVKAVLVEIGQILGSFKGKFAIIGGAVPWLFLANEDMPHVGTLDVDIGLDARPWAMANTPPDRCVARSRLSTNVGTAALSTSCAEFPSKMAAVSPSTSSWTS